MIPSDNREKISKLAIEFDFSPAALLAVVEVESAGKLFARVHGRNEPLIRFEGHYFYRRLKGNNRNIAVRSGLASSKAGRVKNPRSQAKRYDMLQRAMRIDKQAALESISIGVGQVMGAHWQWLGYKSVEAMLARARTGLVGQVELMVKYIIKAKLSGALKRKDWNAFARGYNGPAYRRYKYHTKMAAAYARYAGHRTARPSSATMLRLGSRGARVRELQALLNRQGAGIKVDGDFGDATHNAVMEFQRKNNIEIDGVVGPETQQILHKLRQDRNNTAGNESIVELPETKETITGVTGIGALIVTAKESIQKLLDDFYALESLQTWLTYLLIAVVVAGFIWATWGWFKSRRTYEGDEDIDYADDEEELEVFEDWLPTEKPGAAL